MQISTLTFKEVEPGIKMISLNRPECLNAISIAMVMDMLSVINDLYTDESCRVVILTGKGRGFCAGTDLIEMTEFSKQDIKNKVPAMWKLQKKVSELILGFRNIPQPVIAAVNGVAAGGGMSFALAADIRIAVESAKFIPSFINVGMTSGDMGSSYFLPRLIGQSRASEIMYTGRPVDAREAERIGLVSKVVADDQLIAASVEMARVLLSKSDLGLKFTKEVINSGFDAGSLASAMQVENRQQVVCSVSGSFEENGIAFAEKKNKR